MMTRLCRPRWIWLAVLPSLLAIVAVHAVQGQAPSLVRMETPTGVLMPGGDPFGVNVLVDNVTNLGAFQITLDYDAKVVELQDIKEGPFLGSSGRRVQCLPPQASEGSIDFTCVTLGSTPEGPTGSGMLATLTFKPVSSGTSPLHFQRIILADPPANQLPAQAQDASITVQGGEEGGGFRWVLWGPVIGGAALVLVAAGAVVLRSRR